MNTTSVNCACCSIERFGDQFVDLHVLAWMGRSPDPGQLQNVVQKLGHLVCRGIGATQVARYRLQISFLKVLAKRTEEPLDREQRGLEVVGYGIGKTL